MADIAAGRAESFMALSSRNRVHGTCQAPGWLTTAMQQSQAAKYPWPQMWVPGVS